MLLFVTMINKTLYNKTKKTKCFDFKTVILALISLSYCFFDLRSKEFVPTDLCKSVGSSSIALPVHLSTGSH